MRALPAPHHRPLPPGRVYFVDPQEGKDGNTGALEQPWKSIARAIERLAPGDTLCLRGGTYYEPCLVSLHGTNDQPITIRGYPGELAVIDAGLPEFYEAPSEAWLPAEGGLPDEFQSANRFPGLEKVFGNFGDSMVPLHGYRNLIDLRSSNEFWNGGGKLDRDWGIYCGPGLWYDQRSGRIHCRLAHTKLRALGPDNYRGETDPRKLRLVVTAAPDALHIQLSEHLRVQDLVLRGARRSALHLAHSHNIDIENVTCYGSDPVVNLRGCRFVRLSNCSFRGIAAPWSFRSSHKYRGTPAYLLVSRADDAANRDIEIAHCELTDSHDGPFIGTIRGLRFHHNLVDNFNDDGIYLTSMSLGGDVHIYQNLVSRCLHAFSFFGEYPTGEGVWIYRNIIDLRAPVHYFQPKSDDDVRFTPTSAGGRYRFPSSGRLCGDHGSPIWEPIRFYQNTVVARGAAFRNYYGLGWGGHLKDTTRWVQNNIFVQLEGWPGTSLVAGTENLQAAANLHFGFSGTQPKPTAKSRVPAHDLTADPRFLARPADWRQRADVRLQPNSPAVDAGVALADDWPDTLQDQDKNPPDLGALPLGAELTEIGPQRKR